MMTGKLNLSTSRHIYEGTVGFRIALPYLTVLHFRNHVGAHVVLIEMRVMARASFCWVPS